LAKGFIILEACKEKINSVSDLRNIMKDKKGSAVLLKTSRWCGNNSLEELKFRNKFLVLYKTFYYNARLVGRFFIFTKTIK